jgi:hypothetical protein
VGALALLFFPLTMLIGYVYGFVKAAQWFKSGAAAKAWEKFMGGIKSAVAWLLGIPSRIAQVGSEIGTALSKAFSMENLKSTLKNQFDNVFGAGSADRAMQMMMDAKKWFDDLLNSILENPVVKMAIDGYRNAKRMLGGNTPMQDIMANLETRRIQESSRKVVESRLQYLASGDDGAKKIASIEEAQKQLRASGDNESVALLEQIKKMVETGKSQAAILEEIAQKTQGRTSFVSPATPTPATSR